MKAFYTTGKRQIGRYMTVSIDENDKMISGDKGWIFLANSSGSRVGMVTVLSSTSEKISYHDFKDLEWCVSRIGVLKPAFAATAANDPNRRHD